MRLAHALPAIVVTIHSVVVVGLAGLVAVLGGESVMLWNLMMIIDFPVSWIGSHLNIPIEEWCQTHYGPDVTFTIGYAVYFGMLGGLQYYALVKLVTWFACRLAKGTP